MKLFLVGFMGAGKSYWGAQMAAHLELPFFDLDEEIISGEGKSIEQIFAASGEEYFRHLERDRLYSLTEDHANSSGFVLSTGGGTPCFFNNIEYMKKQGRVVWVNPPVEVLLKRLLKEKSKRPLLKDTSDEDLRRYIQRKLGERKMYYEKADHVIYDEVITPEHFLEIAAHA